MENLVLNHLPFKEKLVLVSCASCSILIFVVGIYYFFIVELIIRELIMTIGMCLMLLSAGLVPKLFFSPLINIFKLEKIPTLGHPRVQQWLFLYGVFFCFLSLAIR